MYQLNRRFFPALALLSLVSACGGAGESDGEPEKCESRDLCSCDVKDVDGFCIDFDSESDFNEEDCQDLGGAVRQENCSTSDLVGACLQGDDCHDPDYFFYDNYAGALPGAETVGDLPAACAEGEFVGRSCAWWSTDGTF